MKIISSVLCGGSFSALLLLGGFNALAIGPLLSQGKASTASSFQAGNEVAKGNDGSSTTRWTAANGTFPQWWKVDLGAVYSLGRVDINWYSATSRAYKYKLEASSDNVAFTTLVDKTANTAFGDTADAVSGSARYLRVTVTGANTGWAAFYECKVYQADTTPPPPPTGLAVTAVGSGGITLSWDAVSNATSYTVFRSTTSGAYYVSIANNITAATYTNSGLTNGTTYYYVVKSVNAAGSSPWSSQASGTPREDLPPLAPSNLSGLAGNTKVTLKWGTSRYASSYNIKRATTSGGPYTTIATNVPSDLYYNSYADAGLNNGTTYYYVINAVNAAGPSPNSNEFSALPTDGITAPWAERILNTDGVTINWTQYASVANSYDQRATLDYRFGPRYSHYHSTTESFPTLSTQANANGMIGHAYEQPADDWYSEGGQVLWSPDATAPAAYQPGVAQAWNGDIYIYRGDTPEYLYIMQVLWNGEFGHSQQMNPDPTVRLQAWKDGSGGTIPAPPVATVRTNGFGGVTGFLLFKNGFIGATGTGNEGYASDYPYTKLAAGKVPTAGAVTLNNEFLLVTVWDTVNRVGQLAVIAVKGEVVGSQYPVSARKFMWGFPSWPRAQGLKVLGYINLPMAAPTSIQAFDDLHQNNGRGYTSNVTMDLNLQEERDRWYNWTGSWDSMKKTPRCGYAIIASRAENKVAFVDLQPLFQYYRQMYFTTQANYDLTKTEGAADNQWPFTFAHAPAQKPAIHGTVAVTKPAAVHAGWFVTSNISTNTNANAYVTTMDGSLLVFDVGTLITTAAGGTIGAPYKTVSIGKNPCAIEHHRGGNLYITCRGDRAIYSCAMDGTVSSVLRDSRIMDPVYATGSHNGRTGGSVSMVHVMDFNGKQILTFRRGGLTSLPPLTEPSGFEFGHINPVPGCPFMFNVAEVP